MSVEQLLNVVILATTALAAIASVPAVVAPLIRLIRGKATAQDINVLNDTASRVVAALEQTSADLSSRQKLNVAIDKVTTYARMAKLKVTDEQIREAIELAVFLLPAGQSLPPAPDDASVPAVPAP